eukprot:Awhi_evm1s2200
MSYASILLVFLLVAIALATQSNSEAFKLSKQQLNQNQVIRRNIQPVKIQNINENRLQKDNSQLRSRHRRFTNGEKQIYRTRLCGYARDRSPIHYYRFVREEKVCEWEQGNVERQIGCCLCREYCPSGWREILGVCWSGINSFVPTTRSKTHCPQGTYQYRKNQGCVRPCPP